MVCSPNGVHQLPGRSHKQGRGSTSSWDVVVKSLLPLLVLGTWSVSVTGAEPPVPLSRTALMQFLDGEKTVQAVRSVADWEQRRAAILVEMQKVMGPLPGPEKR